MYNIAIFPANINNGGKTKREIILEILNTVALKLDMTIFLTSTSEGNIYYCLLPKADSPSFHFWVQNFPRSDKTPTVPGIIL